MAATKKAHRACAWGACPRERETWLVNSQGRKVAGYCAPHGRNTLLTAPASYLLVNEEGAEIGRPRQEMDPPHPQDRAEHGDHPASAADNRVGPQSPGPGASVAGGGDDLSAPPRAAEPPADAGGEAGDTATLPATIGEAEGRLSPFRGYASKRLTPEQEVIINAPVDPTQVEIRPDGRVYLPWTVYAHRLNKAFGPAGWAMLPLSKPEVVENQALVHYALVAEGRYISEATEGHPYFKGNRSQSWAEAVESAKSECLRRCCKVMGCTLELWDKRWIRAWQEKHAMRVWMQQKNAWWWRRRDDSPFPGEGKPGRPSESEWQRPRTVDDEARAHMDSIGREPGEEG